MVTNLTKAGRQCLCITDSAGRTPSREGNAECRRPRQRRWICRTRRWRGPAWAASHGLTGARRRPPSRSSVSALEPHLPRLLIVNAIAALVLTPLIAWVYLALPGPTSRLLRQLRSDRVIDRAAAGGRLTEFASELQDRLNRVPGPTATMTAVYFAYVLIKDPAELGMAPAELGMAPMTLLLIPSLLRKPPCSSSGGQPSSSSGSPPRPSADCCAPSPSISSSCTPTGAAACGSSATCSAWCCVSRRSSAAPGCASCSPCTERLGRRPTALSRTCWAGSMSCCSPWPSCVFSGGRIN
jgi:hypothetical protein